MLSRRFRALYLAVYLALAIALVLPAHARDTASLKTFNAETFTLGNGMQVVVIPNHRVPVVTHMIWYRVGAADEMPGQSGLAHFVEHLMFKGTEEIPPGEFSRRINALGGNHNAFTSHDYTAYYQTVAVEHLETVMAMEADRMNNLVFPPEDVVSERQVVIEERRQRTENDPRGYFGEQMRAALFVNHPYGDPVIGWFHEVDALDRPHVKKFYETWYAPNNAILVVAGDITAAQLKPLAEKTYGALPAEDTPERNWTSVPPLLGLQKLTLRDPTIRQPVLQRLYRVPSYAHDREASLALQVLEEILSGGAATRLYRILVVEKGIATSASMYYSGGNFSESTAGFGLTPAQDVSLEDLEKALDVLLRDLIDKGVTGAELREAKDRLKDKAVFARDSLTGPAMIFGRHLVTGGAVEEVETWPAQIESVTAEQVQDAARQYFHPDNYGRRPYVTGYMLPPAVADESAPATAVPPAAQEAAEPVGGEVVVE